MEKETVVANLRAEMSITEELQTFFAQFEENDNAWFAQDGGALFLSEFGRIWNNNFVEVIQAFYDQYFHELGLLEQQLPKIKITDSRRGSWIIEATLAFPVVAGKVYAILKGIADLPKLADGLVETKKRAQKELSDKFHKTVPQIIEPALSNFPHSIPLPSNTVNVSFSIDARPLRGLTPDTVKSHSIHLAVGVSRSALSVENLGEDKIENLRIGLFKAPDQRHNWNFGDAFSKSIPSLSGKQSISVVLDEFCSDTTKSCFDLLDNSPLYVDCWLQDNSGIYLFNFYIE
jgi:hypothetical protein